LREEPNVATGSTEEGSERFSTALVVVAVSAGAIGAGLLAAVLLATGSLRGGGTVSVITAPAGTTPATALPANASELAPSGVYALAAPGVVDITARVRTTLDTVMGAVPETVLSTGAGSIVDDLGDIVTAEHVVAGAVSVSARLQDGTVRKARILGRDPSFDIAVLKIDPAGLKLHPVALGSSTSLRIGDPVFAIGDPFGFARSLSGGLVSALDRTIVAPNGFTVAHAIQTDASFNPGNSGGPLLDSDGRIVGIVDQIGNGGYQVSTSTGVGFAVPVELAETDLRAIEHGLKPAHAYLGAGATDASLQGALVQTVSANGPAGHAGIKPGDAILDFGASKIRGAGDLVAAIAAHRPGDRVKLTIERSSRRIVVRVTLGRQPARAARR
jgi:putative serine protease PepD